MADKFAIKTDKAPKAIGPYSQAIRSGSLVFLSGQIGIQPESGELVSGGTAEQARQIFKNIRAVLEKSAVNLDDVVKVTVFLTNMADFKEINAIFLQFFGEPFPARSAVAVSELPLAAKIMIEAIAAV